MFELLRLIFLGFLFWSGMARGIFDAGGALLRLTRLRPSQPTGKHGGNQQCYERVRAEERPHRPPTWAAAGSSTVRIIWVANRWDSASREAVAATLSCSI